MYFVFTCKIGFDTAEEESSNVRQSYLEWTFRLIELDQTQELGEPLLGRTALPENRRRKLPVWGLPWAHCEEEDGKRKGKSSSTTLPTASASTGASASVA